MHDPSDNKTTPGPDGRELSEAGLAALAARERTRVVAPLTEWTTLATALREEGIIHAPVAHAAEMTAAVTAMPVVRPRLSAVYQWGVRAIAGAALLGVGAVMGSGWTAGQQIASAIHVAAKADSMDVATATEPGATTAAAGRAVATNDDTGQSSAPRHEPAAPAAFVATNFTSPTEARRVMEQAQAVYTRASAYLATRDTGGAQIVETPRVYQDRLAALDEVAAAAQSALKDAPDDPFIKQYYMSTVGARQATLQQLGRVLPAGVQIKHY